MITTDTKEYDDPSRWRRNAPAPALRNGTELRRSRARAHGNSPRVGFPRSLSWERADRGVPGYRTLGTRSRFGRRFDVGCIERGRPEAATDHFLTCTKLSAICF